MTSYPDQLITDPQEIFDHVAKHLYTQGRKSMAPSIGSPDNSAAFCAYRSKDNLSCAIGCLIPDHLYSPALESHIIYDLVLKQELFVEWRPIFSFLADLQKVHDYADDFHGSEYLKQAWKQELLKVAIKFNLSPAILDTLA